MNRNISIVLILSSIVLMVLPQVVHSQGKPSVVGGVVVDKYDDPLPFAHVYVNDSIGTVTNDSGLFVLKIPNDLQSEIIVSQLGFIRDTISIASHSENEFLTIKLQSAVNILDEVVVSAGRLGVDSAKLILKKVLKSLPRNYPKKKYTMTGFYRETSMLDTTYSRLLEGYFKISDKGYNKSIDKLETQDLHVRKTKDQRELDWRSSLTEWLYSKNGLHTLLSTDRLRLKSDKKLFMEYQEYREIGKAENGEPFRFFTLQFIEDTDFYLDQVVKDSDEEFFVIKYKKASSSSTWLASTIYGEITVSKSDWAIVRWKSTHAFDEKRFVDRYKEKAKGDTGDYKRNYLFHRSRNFAMNDSIFFTLNMQYQKRNDGKYYVDYINYKTIGSVSTFSQVQSFSQSFESKSQVGNIYTSLEFVVSDVGKYSNIRWIDSVSSSKDLYDLDSNPGDPFWNTYNYPSILTMSKKMIEELSAGQTNLIEYINE